MAVPAILLLSSTSLACGIVIALPFASLSLTGARFLRFMSSLAAVLFAISFTLRAFLRLEVFQSAWGSALLALSAIVLAAMAVLAGSGRLAAALRLFFVAIPLAIAALVELAEAIRAAGASPFGLALLAVGTSSLLLGTVTLAMILGHFYLVAPGLSIRPLKRESALFAASVAARGAFAATMGLLTLATPNGPERLMEQVVFLLPRGLFGIVGPAIFAYMVWETVKIRSTQSATGILYVATAFVLFGELSAGYLLLSHNLVL